MDGVTEAECRSGNSSGGDMDRPTLARPCSVRTGECGDDGDEGIRDAADAVRDRDACGAGTEAIEAARKRGVGDGATTEPPVGAQVCSDSAEPPRLSVAPAPATVPAATPSPTSELGKKNCCDGTRDGRGEGDGEGDGWVWRSASEAVRLGPWAEVGKGEGWGDGDGASASESRGPPAEEWGERGGASWGKSVSLLGRPVSVLPLDAIGPRARGGPRWSWERACGGESALEESEEASLWSWDGVWCTWEGAGMRVSTVGLCDAGSPRGGGSRGR